MNLLDNGGGDSISTGWDGRNSVGDAGTSATWDSTGDTQNSSVQSLVNNILIEGDDVPPSVAAIQNDNQMDRTAPVSEEVKEKGLPGPIFMSGGMRTGSQYGGIAKDHRHGDQGYNHTNRNANRRFNGNSKFPGGRQNRHARGTGTGQGGVNGPSKTRKGNVTRVFPGFCIVNSDIYVSKAVVERSDEWPPALGSGVYVNVVPHFQGRNKWKALTYRRDSNLDIVIQPPTIINQQHFFPPRGLAPYPNQFTQAQQHQQAQQAFMPVGIMQQQQPGLAIDGGNVVTQASNGNNSARKAPVGANATANIPNGGMDVDSGYGGLQMQQNRQPYTQNIYAPRQPPQPFEGQITKVFESFCIMNGDIYISKAVAERQTGIWPPQLGEVARVHVVPHQRGRNNWKAVSYVSHSAMMMMSTLI